MIPVRYVRVRPKYDVTNTWIYFNNFFKYFDNAASNVVSTLRPDMASCTATFLRLADSAVST